MGLLYQARLAIEKTIAERSLDPNKMKGQIGLRVGTTVSLIKEDTPDDRAILKKLQAAAKEVLNIDLFPGQQF